jgi:hypothetical protein
MRYLTGSLGKAQAHEVKTLLGLALGAPLPREGTPMRQVQGITVWVAPLVRGPKRHRVLAHCPSCGRTVSAGRLKQHRCGS